MSIKQYEIFKDKNRLPYIKPIKEFDNELAKAMLDEESYSLETKLDILKRFFKVPEYESEHLFVIASTAEKILGVYLEGIGNLGSIEGNPRNMCVFLLLVGAEKCLVVHNHPNDVLQGSDGDKENAQYLRELLNMLDIKFEGSYVISNEGYVNVEDDVVYEWSEYFDIFFSEEE